MNPPFPRPFFYSIDQAQDFLATRFDQITPWLCAQRARAFLYLARRYSVQGRLSIGKQFWRHAGAFVAMGKRIRVHGPRGAVHFPSDWLRSERFLTGHAVKFDAAKLREEFALALEIGDAVDALNALDALLASAIRQRPNFVLAAQKQLEKEKEIGRKLFPTRSFMPTKLARRHVGGCL